VEEKRSFDFILFGCGLGRSSLKNVRSHQEG
jgi:hypothetical protein